MTGQVPSAPKPRSLLGVLRPTAADLAGWLAPPTSLVAEIAEAHITDVLSNGALMRDAGPDRDRLWSHMWEASTEHDRGRAADWFIAAAPPEELAAAVENLAGDPVGVLRGLAWREHDLDDTLWDRVTERAVAQAPLLQSDTQWRFGMSKLAAASAVPRRCRAELLEHTPLRVRAAAALIGDWAAAPQCERAALVTPTGTAAPLVQLFDYAALRAVVVLDPPLAEAVLSELARCEMGTQKRCAALIVLAAWRHSGSHRTALVKELRALSAVGRDNKDPSQTVIDTFLDLDCLRAGVPADVVAAARRVAPASPANTDTRYGQVLSAWPQILDAANNVTVKELSGWGFSMPLWWDPDAWQQGRFTKPPRGVAAAAEQLGNDPAAWRLLFEFADGRTTLEELLSLAGLVAK